MKLSSRDELDILEFVKGTFTRKPRALSIGIGDDASVLMHKGKLLVSKDMMLEGVHFDLALMSPEQIGYKLVAVNVSDIYAMGGNPLYILLGIAVPASIKTSALEALLKGVHRAAEHYRVSVIGGDVSSSKDSVALSATVIGSPVDKPVLRSGARVGHGIYVSGTLGDSACGLELLRLLGRPVNFNRPCGAPLAWDTMLPLLRAHIEPVVRKPGAFVKRASAMMDLSDGLLLDLWRICDQSKVGAMIDEVSVPMSVEMKLAASHMGLDPLSLACSGGEDYKLLFTAACNTPIRGAKLIGRIISDRTMVMTRADGSESKVKPKGYVHFRRR